MHFLSSSLLNALYVLGLICVACKGTQFDGQKDFHCFTSKLDKGSGTCATMSRSIFGSEFEKIWPASGSAWPRISEFGRQLLAKCREVKKPAANASDVDINTFIQRSNEFPLQFPIDSCRVKEQPRGRHERIREQITSAYPVIHERALALYLSFLEHKNRFGNLIERQVYDQLTVTGLVQRLLAQRCVAFLTARDSYMLLDGTRSTGGFESIGTAGERQPLLLKDTLSYDEIKLSALLSVSSQTEFINDGSRFNGGAVERNKSRIETEGIVIGLIGARFERENVMECEDILITPSQNQPFKGYGYAGEPETPAQDYRRIWREFYEEPDFLYPAEPKTSERFAVINGKRRTIFDNVLMKKRYAISFDTLLLESEARAAAAGKPAYVHVVGIGLGVWEVASQQTEIFLETFEQRLLALADRLPHVGCVHFSWFRLNEWRSLHDGALIATNTHPNGGIRIKMSRRNPADKLENMLPIVSYAWDANALPGNEFWLGSLDGSGDPAAACSTLISELHNPHINTAYVNGDNLHIVSEQFGLLHIADYARRRLGEA